MEVQQEEKGRSSQEYVRLQQVTFKYPGVEGTLALHGTSLAVCKGRFAAVVGPSGCGKSTLMKVVSGLDRPLRGDVSIGGVAVDRPLSMVGMAFQNSSLLPWRTTLDNVLLPLEIVLPHRMRFRRERAANIQRAMKLLKLVDLAEFAHKYPWQLSGGMQQRASLCRALIHEPALLLLDEPFGALDTFTKEDLWDVLQRLWIETKATVIMVTHDLREAVYLADQVYVMSARPGKIMHTYDVDLPRPRNLAMTFELPFVELTHRLRDTVSHARKT